MNWLYSTIVGGGEKWQLRSERDATLATLVRLPGSVVRLYWSDEWSDYSTWSDGLRAVREHVGDDVPALPAVPDYRR